MSQEAEIRQKITDIKRQIDKKSRGNQEQSTLSMLFEIEIQLEKFMRFFTICHKIDPHSIGMLVKHIRTKNKETKQIENNKAKNEEEERNNMLRMLKQKKPRKVQGIKMQVYRSSKPAIKQHKQKKETLTEEQKEMKKFLGAEYAEAMKETKKDGAGPSAAQ